MRVGGQPHAPAASTPGKDPVPILQEAGWAPGPIWTGGRSRPHRDSIEWVEKFKYGRTNMSDGARSGRP